jgi:glucose-1-phosphate cytidylyltransferase
VAEFVRDETFMLTYGDGVSDIDIPRLLDFHRAHGKLATVTAVRPPGRFGSLGLDGARVTRFAEKPQVGEGWINGGFFVLEPQVAGYIADYQVPWEAAPLETLAAEGQLMAYQHDAFWMCMDTLRDVKTLDSLWQEGKAPWKVW